MPNIIFDLEADVHSGASLTKNCVESTQNDGLSIGYDAVTVLTTNFLIFTDFVSVFDEN